MKKLIKNFVSISTMILVTSLPINNAVSAQTVFQSQLIDVRLTGTSSLHDWEMKAAKGTSEVAFVLDPTGKITSISRLNFTLPATSLKSDHSMMDKNTYKALNTDKNPNIMFELTSGTVTSTGGNNYQLNCVGKLTIAGTIKETDLIAVGRYNPADQSFTVTGVKKMKMTDYNVKPPTVMLGTIKTGNDIAISYNLKFAR